MLGVKLLYIFFYIQNLKCSPFIQWRGRQVSLRHYCRKKLIKRMLFWATTTITASVGLCASSGIFIGLKEGFENRNGIALEIVEYESVKAHY